MDIIIRRKEDTSVTYEQIVELIHESFKERLEQGLRFTCSFIGVEEYKRGNEHSILLVAITKETKELVGVASLKILLDNNNLTYAYEGSLAIKPGMKRFGIGTKLEEERVKIAESKNCYYITGNTAVGAKSSVKWHKKNGYKIVGLKSWTGTNYYSFVFRKQLVPINLIQSISIFVKCCSSFFRTLLLRKKNGNHRKWVEYFSR